MREWDTDGNHVLDGQQSNTYDIEFYGPNPMMSAIYYAALKAVAEMAEMMGDTSLAAQCSHAL